jgi:hypothetical protein
LVHWLGCLGRSPAAGCAARAAAALAPAAATIARALASVRSCLSALSPPTSPPPPPPRAAARAVKRERSRGPQPSSLPQRPSTRPSLSWTQPGEASMSHCGSQPCCFAKALHSRAAVRWSYRGCSSSPTASRSKRASSAACAPEVASPSLRRSQDLAPGAGPSLRAGIHPAVPNNSCGRMYLWARPVKMGA